MVMRNRHNGSGDRDDLPRRIQERLRALSDVRPATSPAPSAARAWVGDAIILGLKHFCQVFPGGAAKAYSGRRPSQVLLNLGAALGLHSV